jgi:hypothetical protein
VHPTSEGITRAESDHWGGDWVEEAFRKFGITVVPSAKPKSDLYRELLSMLNAHRCRCWIIFEPNAIIRPGRGVTIRLEDGIARTL